jgi:uncharacterized NAD(P)/FAD-binding protein YdhS
MFHVKHRSLSNDLVSGDVSRETPWSFAAAPRCVRTCAAMASQRLIADCHEIDRSAPAGKRGGEQLERASCFT